MNNQLINRELLDFVQDVLVLNVTPQHCRWKSESAFKTFLIFAKL